MFPFPSVQSAVLTCHSPTWNCVTSRDVKDNIQSRRDTCHHHTSSIKKTIHMYIEEAIFIAGRRKECVSTNTSEHKRGGDGYRTRCEYGDKDVRKEDEGGVR